MVKQLTQRLLDTTIIPTDKYVKDKDYEVRPVPESHLRVATVNINRLTDVKLPYITSYVDLHQIDVLHLTDIRINKDTAAHYRRLIIRRLGPGTRVVVALGDQSRGGGNYNVPGGILTIVTKKWGMSMTNTWQDRSGMGVTNFIYLKCRFKKIMLVGTYWPVLPTSSDPTDSQGLWNRLAQWMAKSNETGTPIEYIKKVIEGKLLHFQGTDAEDCAGYHG